uniref:ATP synthase complex subunit 8 n=1 Tax=Luperomorpha xanthodera TaxID=715851 RepID=A0A343C4X0_9CUCU|nr:ATP synthase F0 subunit 8 [Luperomorpha xanthodera]ARH55076.1 ATP synthase F0 subunit 8 [Luperomorpha xanthodera]WFQ81653.1 ATP synthase F0 subunit 8 [Luperomorpha xanthodera]
MPQMMPLNWLTLMFFFITSFYMFNNLNYFNIMYMSKKQSILKKYLKFNWKW